MNFNSRIRLLQSNFKGKLVKLYRPGVKYTKAMLAISYFDMQNGYFYGILNHRSMESSSFTYIKAI